MFFHKRRKLDRFDELVINNLFKIKRGVKKMSEKVDDLKAKVAKLETAQRESNERDRQQEARSAERISELQAALDQANTINEQTDADLDPIIERLEDLIDAEDAENQDDTTSDAPPADAPPADETDDTTVETTESEEIPA